MLHRSLDLQHSGGVEVALLAIVQGIAEFLPVSSSGHIVVLVELFEARFDPFFAGIAAEPAIDDVLLMMALVEIFPESGAGTA